MAIGPEVKRFRGYAWCRFAGMIGPGGENVVNLDFTGSRLAGCDDRNMWRVRGWHDADLVRGSVIMPVSGRFIRSVPDCFEISKRFVDTLGFIWFQTFKNLTDMCLTTRRDDDIITHSRLQI